MPVPKFENANGKMQIAIGDFFRKLMQILNFINADGKIAFSIEDALKENFYSHRIESC